MVRHQSLSAPERMPSPTDFAFTLTGTRAEAMNTRAAHTRNLVRDFIMGLA